MQAQAEGLVVHQMGGFDPAAAAAVFDLDAGANEPLVVVAVGHHDPAAVLPELARRGASTRPASGSPSTTCSSPPPRQALPMSGA